MRVLLFLDLDDTIFQTKPKCPADEALHPAALGRDGAALSFMTARQRAFLEMWLRVATVIPTTARNLDAYRRVDLPFEHAAILDFGGVVLSPTGELDPDWDARVRPRALAASRDLQALHQQAERVITRHKLGIRVRVIGDFDMPLYVIAKHPDGDSAKLQTLCDELAPIIDRERFFVHLNDNNLSFVPAFLGKEHAVRHVRAKYFAVEPVLTVGMGDSLTDAAFLDDCDFSLMPRGSQLAWHRFPRGEGA